MSQNYVMRIIQLFALVTVAMLSGCSIMNHTSDIANLGETTWKLVSINGTPVSLGGNAVIQFDEKESKVSGIAACNSFGADYEMLRNTLKFEDIVTTKKYCEGKMDEEDQIISNLQNVTRYDVKADKLYFYGKDQLLLTYKR